MCAMADDHGNDGFGEAPQRALEGRPRKGSISDWAAEIAQEVPHAAPAAGDPAKPQTPHKRGGRAAQNATQPRRSVP